MIKKTGIFVMLSILWLALASLACGAIGFPEPYPEPTVSLERQVQIAQTEAAQYRILALSFDESLLTGWLTSKIDNKINPYLYPTSIKLKNGKIRVIGDIILHLDDHTEHDEIRIDLSDSIDAEGKLVFAVTSVRLDHPLTGFEGLDKTISAFVAETFTDMLVQATSGYHLESITINDGLMTLRCRAK
jgi:hypothetical protein